jgi:hypothetical protein
MSLHRFPKSRDIPFVGPTRKLILLLLSRRQRMDPKRALTDHDVWPNRRDLCCNEMPVLLPRIVARVQHVYACDLDHEHGGAEDVPGVVRREPETAGYDDVLVVVYRDDGLPCEVEVVFRVQTVGRVGRVVTVREWCAGSVGRMSWMGTGVLCVRTRERDGRQAHPIRTASCMVNRKMALVGCVMYTFPLPSLKLVCAAGSGCQDSVGIGSSSTRREGRVCVRRWRVLE